MTFFARAARSPAKLFSSVCILAKVLVQAAVAGGAEVEKSSAVVVQLPPSSTESSSKAMCARLSALLGSNPGSANADDAIAPNASAGTATAANSHEILRLFIDVPDLPAKSLFT